jgi:hypothetical protein
MNRYAAGLGGKAVHEKYEFHGEKNPNWKGGIKSDNYHYKKIQKRRHPERVRCREILYNSKRNGKIVPPERCEHCNKKTKLHAHHDDYSKPFDVTWLCRPCHRQLHGGMH